MGRKRISSELFVYMNGQRVGTLIKKSSNQLIFTYHQDWLNGQHARPISLSIPMREQPFDGPEVYNFFDNLLPDNESLRSRIQRRFGTNTSQCFDLLSHIGTDCVGALQLTNSELDIEEPLLKLLPVNKREIHSILKNYHDAPLGMGEDTDFRISLAGAQEKTAFTKRDGRWYVPIGTTPTTHIFKLPIGKIKHSGIDLSESVENEWLCLQLLSEFNLPVCNAQIQAFGGSNVLICERFDRKWHDDGHIIYRLPQEDMCQVLGLSPSLKYESDGGPGIVKIMELLNGSFYATKDRFNFFKACFLFWVMGAIDGHAKNFSIHIKSQGRFRLTPFYDVISAYPLVDKKQLQLKKLKMAMAVFGKNRHYHWDKIMKQHWVETASHAKLSEKVVSEIMSSVLDPLEIVIDSVSSRLPVTFPEKIADSIFEGMKQVKKKFK